MDLILASLASLLAGGTSAAQSFIVGTPCFLPSRTNSSSRICPTVLLLL